MKLTSIEIKNFRGIKHCRVIFPIESRIICLIGAGDSGKSTLLKAIEWVLWPTWNLVATDTDFYNCETGIPIEIIASVTDLPDSLLKDDKLGLFLRDNASVLLGLEDDEPKDNRPVIITIKLTIDSSLEPKWEVITSRTDPHPISQKDRRLLSFGVVGFDYDKDFQWGRSSVLQKYTDSSKEALHNAFTQAMRTAAANTTLDALDQLVPSITTVGGLYGVPFNGEVHNRLMMLNGSYSSTVGIFDGEVPFSQRGLGSKRLLSIGMNVNAYKNGTVVLVDEIETGLEPHRLSTLINAFRTQFNDNGQLIMTTHSVSAVCECTIHEVMICSNVAGELKIHHLNSIDDIKADVQGLLRAHPEAFLSKRLIVCEGKTEVGLLRAFDSYLVRKTNKRLAHYGVSVIPGGGGDSFFQLAKLLHECGYEVSILMDSDINTEETKKKEMRSLGIPVFDWESGLAIEEQLFKDVSVDCINALLAIAVEAKSFEHVRVKLSEAFPSGAPYTIVNDEFIVLDGISRETRIRIGSVAKHQKSGWYKNISTGELVGSRVFLEYESMGNCYFKTQMTKLQNWVTGSES